MTIYTVVYDGYDIFAYTSLAATMESIVHDEYVLNWGVDNPKPVTAKEIISKLKTRRNVYLYEVGNRSWICRIDKH